MSRRFAKHLNVFSFIFLLTVILGTGGLTIFTASAYAAGGTAKGTIKIKDKTVDLKHAYLVKGPDAFDSSKTVSTVIITPNDISKEITECKSASCASGITEGMTVGKEDFGSTTRVVYWVDRKSTQLQSQSNLVC